MVYLLLCPAKAHLRRSLARLIELLQDQKGWNLRAGIVMTIGKYPVTTRFPSQTASCARLVSTQKPDWIKCKANKQVLLLCRDPYHDRIFSEESECGCAGFSSTTAVELYWLLPKIHFTSRIKLQRSHSTLVHCVLPLLWSGFCPGPGLFPGRPPCCVNLWRRSTAPPQTPVWHWNTSGYLLQSSSKLSGATQFIVFWSSPSQTKLDHYFWP